MSQKPNFLFITTDQQRFDTIQSLGAPHMLTPHLDWLAGTGVSFERAYTDSPVCVSSRACMLTGRHFHRMPGFGWWGQPSAEDPQKTLPALLTRVGYQTHGYGKFHYHPTTCNYGWEHMEPLAFYYREARECGLRPMDHGLGQNEMEPVIGTVSENETLTHWTVERGIRFLETRDSTRPFCLYLGFSKPHPPFDPPLSYWNLYQNRTMPPPVYGDWSKNPDEMPAGFMGPTWALNGCDRWSGEQIREMRRAYFALITHIDYQLGRLFARLRELGLLETTWIVFTSDHGEMLGDHHMGAKSVFLEPSAHVPMLLRPADGHGSLRGTSCDSIASMADVLPTFCQLAGAEIPERCDGISLVDQANGTRRRDRLFFHVGPMRGVMGEMAGVLDGSFKYMWSASGDDELLFNLEKDPQETENLAENSGHQETRRRLAKLLAEEMQASGHAFAASGDLVPTTEKLARTQVRAAAWPGFHSRDHTPEDLLH